MGQATGQVITFAVGVALSASAIIAVVLMLATPKARSNGPAFLLGWMLGLTVVGTIALIAASGAEASENGAPATWVSILKIILGVLLLLVAARQRHAHTTADAEPDLPGWMKRVDTFTAPRAAAVAFVLAALNPKNLLLTVGAAAAIAQTSASTGDQAAALAVFVVLGTAGPGIPVAIYFLMHDRAKAILENLRAWMVHENAAITAVICLIIAAKLIGDAITGLTS